MTSKTILIVEDDPTISLNFRLYCQLAIEELKKSDLCASDDFNVVVADRLDKAWQVFRSDNVFLISLDLNLKDGGQGKQVSGMVFLRELRQRGEETMVLVASSETNISNSTEALQKLKAIGYYVKSELNQTKYQKAIEAAIFYQNAVDLLSKFDQTSDPEFVDAAKKSLQKVKEASETASINYGSFPEDLEVRLVEKSNELVDKFTKLPSNTWVEAAFRKHILGKTDWTMLKVEILNLDHLKASQVSELLRQTGTTLQSVPVEFKYDDAFVGSYQIQRYPVFVVVIFHNAKMDYPKIFKWVSKQFETYAPTFTNKIEEAMEKTVSKSVPRMEIKAWHSDTTEFFDLHEMINVLG